MADLKAIMRSKGFQVIVVSDETWGQFCNWLNDQEEEAQEPQALSLDGFDLDFEASEDDDS